MKRVRFTEEQIITVYASTRLGRRQPIWCARTASEAKLYNWKAKYGGLDVSEAKRLRRLEDENWKLKKLLAESMLITRRKELLGKKWAGPRRSAMLWLICVACWR